MPTSFDSDLFSPHHTTMCQIKSRSFKLELRQNPRLTLQGTPASIYSLVWSVAATNRWLWIYAQPKQQCQQYSLRRSCKSCIMTITDVSSNLHRTTTKDVESCKGWPSSDSTIRCGSLFKLLTWWFVSFEILEDLYDHICVFIVHVHLLTDCGISLLPCRS